jgi:hypothetical protein
VADADAATAIDPLIAVCDAILRLFPTYDALELFLRTNVGLWLNRITDRTKGLDIVALDVATWSVKEDGGKALPARLADTFKGDADLAALAKSLAINSADFPPLQAEFTGLKSLAGDTTGRQALLPYRLDLKQLCKIAIRIGGWKFLHDQVDFLRNNVAAPLETIKARAAAPSDVIDMSNIARTLATIVAAIQGKAAEMQLTDDDLPWIPDYLLVAQDNLGLAAQSWPAKDKLDAVVADLAMITTKELGALNAKITEMASTIDSLSLPDKLAALQQAIAATANAGQTTDEVASVSDSVKKVLALVDGHSRWQNVKDSFTGMLLAMVSLAEANQAWGRLKRQIDKIIDKPDDLLAAQADLVATLGGSDLVALQRAIITLNSVISNRFFAIDKDLLLAAGGLGKIGGSLKEVLDKLDG